jgi:hypothetical protein
MLEHSSLRKVVNNLTLNIPAFSPAISPRVFPGHKPNNKYSSTNLNFLINEVLQLPIP